MCVVSVGSSIGFRTAARRGSRFGHEPVHPDVLRVHGDGGNDEGVDRESDGRGAMRGQQGIVVAAAVAQAPAVPVEGESGDDDEVQPSRPRPVRVLGLPDAERSGHEPGARGEPRQAVPARDRIPRRHGDPPARPAAGAQDRARGGLARGGQVDGGGAGGTKRRQADEARRGPGRTGREVARVDRRAEPAHAATERRLAAQDGTSGARGVLLWAAQASIRRRRVSS
jgi:hypothetical protein